MNRFFPLLLILLLLTGCAPQTPSSPPEVMLPSDSSAQTVPFMTYVEDGRLVPQYTLPEKVSGFLVFEDHLLFFCGEDATVLTLVDPVSGNTVAMHETGMALYAENGTVRRTHSGLSYFNGQAGEIIVLDSGLQEIQRIQAPEKLTGMPLLSRDGSTLYYCTDSAIRALDIGSGIHRILREASYPVQGLSGLLLEDSVLQLSITEADGTLRTLFLSCETGQLLGDYEGNILPETMGERFFLRQQDDSILFGTAGESPMVLTPWFAADHSFFLGDRVLTAFYDQDALALQLYSLDSGMREACFLGIPPENTLLSASADGHGRIWLLCHGPEGTLLYHWDPSETTVKDTTNYISPRHTRQEPDLDALAACSLYARELSHRHGVEILVYTDAVALQPWDYELEYAYDAPALYRELEQLDSRLSNYPPGFLQTLAGKFDGIKICIVNQIRGTPESGSVDIANGIQFWDGYTAYIVLAAGHDTEKALYHELCHLMDTVVLTESTAYDQWEQRNPSGFRYANSYDHTLKAEDWRQAGWESFLDDYSLSYPKEDRARIMEYAMTAGNAEHFQSPYLQAKLRLLCTGIREAFGLEDSAETFLWEQYLDVPMAAKD